MRTHYQAGEYKLIRWTGETIHIVLHKSQAKALFELMRDNRMNIQSLEFIQ